MNVSVHFLINAYSLIRYGAVNSLIRATLEPSNYKKKTMQTEL